MARSIVSTIAVAAFIAVFIPTLQASAQGRSVFLQQRSPSDQPPAELLPPQPTVPGSQRIQQAPQQPLMSQKGYIVQKSAVCCPAYCYRYHQHRKFRRSCCGYCTPTKMVLPVADPIRCGCTAEVCVTVPTCCTGSPHVISKVGLFGRGIVIYKWPNGQMVQVIFKKKVPEVLVHTFY